MISAAGPLVEADAPLASDNDNPAAPNTGTALLRRFRFDACLVRAILGSPILFQESFRSTLTVRATHFTLGMETLARRGVPKFHHTFA